jgi:renalase
MTRLAIIGAGLSGLLLAQSLKDCAEVTVFEKARGVGGRCATRLAEPYSFDHGAQFFTARRPAFQTYLQPLIEQGVIARWQGEVVNLTATGYATPRHWDEVHYVGAPRMNSWCHALTDGLNIQLNTEVAPFQYANGWHLQQKESARELGAYDWVISTAPPEQTRILLGDFARYAPILAQVSLQACHALMVGLPVPPTMAWIGARVQGSPLKWISVDSRKPGRNPALTCLVAHTNNVWAQEQLETDPAEVEQILTAELERIVQLSFVGAPYKKLHRWKYAIVAHGRKTGPLVVPEQRFAVTSDWAYSSRLEEVWQAAGELALRLRPLLTQ